MTATIINLHRPYPVPDAHGAAESARVFEDGGSVARQEQDFGEHVTLPKGHWEYYAGFILALAIIIGGQIMGWWA